MTKWICIIVLIPFTIFSQGIVIGDTVSANVSYHNIPDVYLQINPQSPRFSMDLDSNSIADLEFDYSIASGTWGGWFTVYVYPKSNIEFITTTTQTTWVDSITRGSFISSANNWNNCSGGGVLKHISINYSNPSSNINKGVFIGDNKFLGYRLILPNDTIYGWILMKVNTGYNNVVVKSYALEKKCSVINCVGIKENYMQELNLYPNPATDRVFITEKNDILTNSDIKIINCQGQIVINCKFENTLDVKVLPNGMYLLEIKTPDGYLRKKMVIQR